MLVNERPKSRISFEPELVRQDQGGPGYRCSNCGFDKYHHLCPSVGRLFRSITIMLLGLFFAWSETAYFGWNLMPRSAAETICDGIALLIMALGIFLWRRG